jgi:hypothetical protein
MAASVAGCRHNVLSINPHSGNQQQPRKGSSRSTRQQPTFLVAQSTFQRAPSTRRPSIFSQARSASRELRSRWEGRSREAGGCVCCSLKSRCAGSRQQGTASGAAQRGRGPAPLGLAVRRGAGGAGLRLGRGRLAAWGACAGGCCGPGGRQVGRLRAFGVQHKHPTAPPNEC